MFIAEAVEVLAVGVGIEGVVARGDGAFVTEVVALRVLDLWTIGRGQRDQVDYKLMLAVRRTQKSTSRLPAPPNSLSPTWNVTVILSSLWSCSWKHSREWAPRLMLCATTREDKRSEVERREKRKVRMMMEGRRGGGGLEDDNRVEV